MASRRWGPKHEVIREAFTSRKINIKTGRLAKHYKCKSCKKEFILKDIQVDHINPVVNPHIGFQDWDTFIYNMFCERNGFQVLCKSCHKTKTDREKLIAKNRKNNERQK
jgi:5-methylcytosine-specific restriction endonuclease McrA